LSFCATLSRGEIKLFQFKFKNRRRTLIQLSSAVGILFHTSRQYTAHKSGGGGVAERYLV